MPETTRTVDKIIKKYPHLTTLKIDKEDYLKFKQLQQKLDLDTFTDLIRTAIDYTLKNCLNITTYDNLNSTRIVSVRLSSKTHKEVDRAAELIAINTNTQKNLSVVIRFCLLEYLEYQQSFDRLTFFRDQGVIA